MVRHYFSTILYAKGAAANKTSTLNFLVFFCPKVADKIEGKKWCKMFTKLHLRVNAIRYLEKKCPELLGKENSRLCFEPFQ